MYRCDFLQFLRSQAQGFFDKDMLAGFKGFKHIACMRIVPGGNKYDVPERWRAILASQLSGEEIVLGFRPEAAHANGKGSLSGEVYASDLHGAYNMMHIALEEENVEAMVHIRGERGYGHEIGDTARFELEPEMVRFFDPHNERAIVI